MATELRHRKSEESKLEIPADEDEEDLFVSGEEPEEEWDDDDDDDDDDDETAGEDWEVVEEEEQEAEKAEERADTGGKKGKKDKKQKTKKKEKKPSTTDGEQEQEEEEEAAEEEEDREPIRVIELRRVEQKLAHIDKLLDKEARGKVLTGEQLALVDQEEHLFLRKGWLERPLSEFKTNLGDTWKIKVILVRKKDAFFVEPFGSKNDGFTKTGSNQTNTGNPQKRVACFSQDETAVQQLIDNGYYKMYSHADDIILFFKFICACCGAWAFYSPYIGLTGYDPREVNTKEHMFRTCGLYWCALMIVLYVENEVRKEGDHLVRTWPNPRAEWSNQAGIALWSEMGDYSYDYTLCMEVAPGQHGAEKRDTTSFVQRHFVLENKHEYLLPTQARGKT
eukprot:COSAG06_NODE_1079_length_10793_cov_2.779596_5_plen_393_part_00